MRALAIVTESGRSVFSAAIDDFEALGHLKLPSKFSFLLLAGDASAVETAPLYDAAERLINAGVVYVCTWGADCERVHDLFDEAEVGDGAIDRGFTLMTTWHSGQSLAEAVDYFLGAAQPQDRRFHGACYVAVALGDQSRSHLEELVFASEHVRKAVPEFE
jgi:hypothetical protein